MATPTREQRSHSCDARDPHNAFYRLKNIIINKFAQPQIKPNCSPFGLGVQRESNYLNNKN